MGARVHLHHFSDALLCGRLKSPRTPSHSLCKVPSIEHTQAKCTKRRPTHYHIFKDNSVLQVVNLDIGCYDKIIAF